MIKIGICAPLATAGLPMVRAGKRARIFPYIVSKYLKLTHVYWALLNPRFAKFDPYRFMYYRWARIQEGGCKLPSRTNDAHP